jgi:hypothetical protein
MNIAIDEVWQDLLLVWRVSEITATTVCLGSPLLVDKYTICLQQPATRLCLTLNPPPSPPRPLNYLFTLLFTISASLLSNCQIAFKRVQFKVLLYVHASIATHQEYICLQYQLTAKTSGMHACMNEYPSTLANSTLNYIIFRNVEIFKFYFFQIKKILWRILVIILEYFICEINFSMDGHVLKWPR